jgi:hypothetical protein
MFLGQACVTLFEPICIFHLIIFPLLFLFFSFLFCHISSPFLFVSWSERLTNESCMMPNIAASNSTSARGPETLTDLLDEQIA